MPNCNATRPNSPVFCAKTALRLAIASASTCTKVSNQRWPYGFCWLAQPMSHARPCCPARRTADIIRDCDIRCVITHRPRLRGVKALSAESIRLDTLIDEGDYDIATITFHGMRSSKRRMTRYPTPASPNRDLAYIMYTSGSTGMPKGDHAHPSQRSELRAVGGTHIRLGELTTDWQISRRCISTNDI